MDQIYAECGDKSLVLTITSVFARVFDGIPEGKFCPSTSGATQLLPNLQISQVDEFIKRLNFRPFRNYFMNQPNYFSVVISYLPFIFSCMSSLH
ncbi:hypothetical protein LINGRAHAP2_LOCUS6936 [Linum grandiflorum]